MRESGDATSLQNPRPVDMSVVLVAPVQRRAPRTDTSGEKWSPSFGLRFPTSAVLKQSNRFF